MSEKIIQLLPVTSSIYVSFPKVSESWEKRLVLPVEMMVLVDYDGEREIEYGAVLDGKMMLFNVDGEHVVLEKGISE